MIVEHKRITAVLAGTARSGRAQRKEERIECGAGSTVERIARLVKDFDRAVDRVDVVIGADITVRVWWQTATTALHRVHPIKCEQWARHPRHWPQKSFHQRLELCEAGGPGFCWRSCLRPRISCQPFLLNLLGGRNIRKAPQILDLGDRTNHRHNCWRASSGLVLH